MTIQQAKKIILDQINSNQSQTFLIEGGYKVGQKTLAKELVSFFTTDTISDVFWLFKDIEKSSIGIGEISSIKQNLNKTPLYSPYIFFIIEDADFITKEAQNSLLKIIEEPSSHTIIMLLGTYHELLPTIYSRCLSLYLDIGEITDLSLGHYDLYLEMQADSSLFDKIYQIWVEYLNVLQSSDIDLLTYSNSVSQTSIQLYLFIWESVHHLIALAQTDKPRYTNIILPENLKYLIDNISTNLSINQNYNILDKIQVLKKTILFSNRKNELAIEQFLLSK